MNELQKELRKIYPEKEEGLFGRRKATPKEVLETISMRVTPDGHNFPNLLEVYPPTERDIKTKDESHNQRRKMRRITRR